MDFLPKSCNAVDSGRSLHRRIRLYVALPIHNNLSLGHFRSPTFLNQRSKPYQFSVITGLAASRLPQSSSAWPIRGKEHECLPQLQLDPGRATPHEMASPWEHHGLPDSAGDRQARACGDVRRGSGRQRRQSRNERAAAGHAGGRPRRGAEGRRRAASHRRDAGRVLPGARHSNWTRATTG